MNFGLFVFALTISSSWAGGPINARAVLDNPVTGVSGVLNLTQLAHGVQVTGQVSGLTPGKHGFHIHQWGDIYTKGCDSTGGHYNPAGVRIISSSETINRLQQLISISHLIFRSPMELKMLSNVTLGIWVTSWPTETALLLLISRITSSLFLVPKRSLVVLSSFTVSS